jgi:hypothetical protein
MPQESQPLQQHAQHSWITFSLYVIEILVSELRCAAWGAVEMQKQNPYFERRKKKK